MNRRIGRSELAWLQRELEEDIALTMGSRRLFLRSAVGLLATVLGNPVARAFESLWTTYQTPDAFVAEAFGGAPPPAKVAQGPTGQRLRYWRVGDRTAWVLDDLGKQGYQPTTAGFIIKGNAIEKAKILVYRESRGEQVGDDSFLSTFTGAKLSGGGLDKPIDNISGATLSVQMVQRMARTVLTLNASAV